MSQRSNSDQIKEAPLPPSRTVHLLVDFINPLDFEGAKAIRFKAPGGGGHNQVQGGS